MNILLSFMIFINVVKKKKKCSNNYNKCNIYKDRHYFMVFNFFFFNLTPKVK